MLTIVATEIITTEITETVANTVNNTSSVNIADTVLTILLICSFANLGLFILMRIMEYILFRSLKKYGIDASKLTTEEISQMLEDISRYESANVTNDICECKIQHKLQKGDETWFTVIIGSEEEYIKVPRDVFDTHQIGDIVKIDTETVKEADSNKLIKRSCCLYNCEES